MIINQLNIDKMKRLFVTLLLMTSFMASGIAYDFSAVCESGQTLYYSINQGTETVQLVNGSYNNGDPRPSGNLVIPATVEYEGTTYTIESVWHAFNGCIELREVTFKEPSSVTKLSYGSFEGCTGLVTVHLPSSLTEIGSDSFKNCNALQNVNVSENVTIIGSFAFNGCSSISEIVLSENLSEVGSHAFKSCTSLQSIIIPGKVLRIGDYAFAECKKLTDVIIGNSVETIGISAFENCVELQSLDFTPESNVTNINSRAFENCTKLTGMILPNSLKTIGGSAFRKCQTLTNVVIPNNVIKIDASAFEQCGNIANVELGESVEEIGNSAFRDIPLLTRVDIPNNVIRIDDYAFASCTGLKMAIIGNKVTTIGSCVFESCSNLEHIEIGCNLTNISYNAFKGTNLQSMTVKAIYAPNLKSNTFQGVSRDIPIIIPCGSLERYQNKDYWNEFTNFTEDFVLSFDAMSENEELGTVNIIKEPITCDDMTVEVEAAEKNGSVFKGWEANGMYVSSDNPYSFTLEEDIVLVAWFSGMGLEESEKERINVYPNPSNGTVTIDGLEVTEVQVFNALGQLVKETKENVIDLLEQEAGTYILKVITPAGVVTKQIVKN